VIEEPVVVVDGLRGIRHRPAVGAGAAVILQGYFSSTHVGPARLYVELARHLAARHSLDTWRLDPRGVGDSDGDFADTTFASEREDYKRILAHVRETVSAGPLTLVGHSLGCALALHLAAAFADRLLLISPSFGSIAVMFDADQLRALRERGRAVRKGVVMRRDFVDDIEADLVPLARTLAVPARFIRGANDAWFPRESVARVAGAMRDAAVVDVDGADHNFLVEGSRPKLWAAISAALAAAA
jgi:pimeloyl-ACP methyl ester carboxylesterase